MVCKHLLLVFILFVLAAGLIPVESRAQIILNNLLVNDHQANTVGVWRPRIAAAQDGSFSVAWQDYNDRPGINFNSVGRSQVAVQRFSSAGQPLEQIHFFRGESTLLSMWLSDYLEHAELAYLSTGELLLLMQHAGRFVIGADDVASSEVTIGAIAANGTVIKLSNTAENVQHKLYFETSTRQYHPRLAITPQDLIVAILEEKSNDSNFRNVAFRVLNTSFNELITREVPHSDGVGSAPHIIADIASNGELTAAVWQDGRFGDLWSVSVQFYTQQGAKGANQRMNQFQQGSAFAVVPSIAMNSSGQTVAAWFDSRNGAQLFGQRFNASGTPLGGNFQISDTPPGSDIYSRPEVAVRNDGSFMVVWTDSTQVPGFFRARARQFDAAGHPVGEPFILSPPDLTSGRPHVATEGTVYYCTWIDNRLNQNEPNIFAKVMGDVATSGNEDLMTLPARATLHQNYPNPFNPSTSIRFELPENATVRLTIVDVLGREVTQLVHDHLPAGVHSYAFDAGALPAGLYISRLVAGKEVLTRKMLLVK